MSARRPDNDRSRREGVFGRQELGIFGLAPVLEIDDVVYEALIVKDLRMCEKVQVEGIGQALNELQDVS